MAKSKKNIPSPSIKPKLNSTEKSKNIFSKLYQVVDISSANDALLKKIFFGLSTLILLITLVLSQKAGINADDRMQNEYEQKLMSFYGTMGKDTAALNLPKTKMQYYGGVFEVLTGLTNKIMGQDSPDNLGYHKVRHAWSAIFGTTAMVFAGLLAAEIGGWLAGLLALLMIFLTPSFLGHSLMNPKDIPFATGYIMSLFFTYRLLKFLPELNRKTIIWLGVALGISLGVRAGGLINFAILAMMLGLHFLSQYGFSGIFSKTKELILYLKAFILPSIIGYFIAIIFWPYALQHPISNVMKSLSELSDYGVNIRLLFNGDMVFAQSLPKDYLPSWVLVTVPIIVLLSWLLHAIFIRGIWKRYNPMALFMVSFGFLFPFLYVMYKGSTVYDGWRHMLFPYTAGIVFGALGLGYLLDKFQENKAIHYGILGITGLLLLSPAWFTIKNPAYPYVYFNEIVGGIDGTDGKWENDYWGTSVKQGVEWLEKERILKPGMTDTVVLASNFYYQLEKYVKPKYKDHVKVVYVKYRQRYDQTWDYGLFVNRFMDASYLQKKSFPPKNTIHDVKANNVTLLAIVKDKTHDASKGVAFLKAGNWQKAINSFQKSLEDDPKNEVSLSGTANAYLAMGQNEKVKEFSDKCLEIDPDNTNAWNYLGIYYLNKKEFDKASEALNKAISISSNNSIGYYYLAVMEQQKGNLQAAVDQAVKCIESNQNFAAGYQLLSSIYEQSGNSDQAAKVMQAMPKTAK